MHRRRPRSEKPLTEHEIDCNFENLAQFRQWYREHGEEEAWRRADEAGLAVPEFRRLRATTKELWDHYAARFGRYFLTNAELKRWNRGEDTFPSPRQWASWKAEIESKERPRVLLGPS